MCLPFLCEQLLERIDLQVSLGQQALQLRILDRQFLQPLNIAFVQPAVPTPPGSSRTYFGIDARASGGWPEAMPVRPIRLGRMDEDLYGIVRLPTSPDVMAEMSGRLPTHDNIGRPFACPTRTVVAAGRSGAAVLGPSFGVGITTGVPARWAIQTSRQN